MANLETAIAIAKRAIDRAEGARAFHGPNPDPGIVVVVVEEVARDLRGALAIIEAIGVDARESERALDRAAGGF